MKSGTSQRARRSQSQGNTRRSRLSLSAAGVIPKHVPKRWVKFVVGIFLIPPALVLTQTFFTAFARTTVRDRFWITEEFWFFSLGVLLWMVAFFGLPRPQWLYVFGHELTHAIWVTASRRPGASLPASAARVAMCFRIERIPGSRWHLFFFRSTALLAISIFGFCGLFLDMTPYRCLLYAVIGATWAMHLSFTCWMIPKGQPDFHYGGTFFSVMVIYVMNLALLAALLIIASPQLTWLGFGT